MSRLVAMVANSLSNRSKGVLAGFSPFPFTVSWIETKTWLVQFPKDPNAL